MFWRKDQVSYFLLGHAHLMQLLCLAASAVLLIVVYVIISPEESSQGLEDPMKPLTMMEYKMILLREVPRLYESNLTVPPLLRHTSYWNHSMCHINFFKEEHEECVHRDSLQTFRANLKGAPDPFQGWNATLCGPLPFSPNKYHYSTGQGPFRSRECMTCYHDEGGHLLQLPVTRDQKNTCVLAPLRVWLYGHVGHDTHFVHSDSIQIVGGEVVRKQIGFQHLALDMWWAFPSTTRLVNQSSLWITCCALCAWFSLLQLVAVSFEMGRVSSPWILRALRAIFQLALVAMCIWMSVSFGTNVGRWEQLLSVLESRQTESEADEVKHRDVWTRYQAHTSYLQDVYSQKYSLLVLTFLQALSFLSRSGGYLHGLTLCLRRLVTPFLLGMAWYLFLAVVGCATQGQFKSGFKDVQTSLATLLSFTRFHNTTGLFSVVWYLSLFLVFPVLLGIVLAEIEMAWKGKRGSSRWWGPELES